ncbi:MAG TPA: sensor histidine kinase [Desulfobacterales bacterium]|nr:sensor histidine kinase [Desulfobacterales bacterium]
MSIRRKIIISLFLIIFIIAGLLSFNTIMAGREGRYVKRLLLIHHQYTALLNLKIHVNRQLSEAQDVFIYGKGVDVAGFKRLGALAKGEGRKLADALRAEDVLLKGAGGRDRNSGNERRLLRLDHDYEDLQRQLVLMASLVNMGRKVKAQEHFKRVISRRFGGFFTEIDNWIAIKRAELQATEAGFSRINRRNNYSTIAALSVILLLTVIFAGALVYILESRIRELLRVTERISAGDLQTMAPVRGHDEFSRFAGAMNTMIAGLAASRKRLLEQSYYSGMADMVAGTIHNLRNSLAPVVVDLEAVQGRLTNIRSEQLCRAIDEINGKAAGDVDNSRRCDLLEFIKLSSLEFERQLPLVRSDLDEISAKIALLVEVMNQASRYTAAERALETVTLAEVIKDAMALIGEREGDTITIETAPEVNSLAAFSSQRIVLVQILVNLIDNGLEAVRKSGRADGLLKINAVSRGSEKGRELAVMVTDNGIGISKEMAGRIFQRGISSKSGSYGLGLHWCANAASSLNGSLRAESDGEGRGTVMILTLSV